MKIIHDRNDEAGRYRCAHMHCERKATLVYQGPTHPAIYGVCGEHRKKIEATHESA